MSNYDFELPYTEYQSVLSTGTVVGSIEADSKEEAVELLKALIEENGMECYFNGLQINYEYIEGDAKVLGVENGQADWGELLVQLV